MRTRQHETTQMPEQKKTNSKIPVGPTKERAMHYKNRPIQIYWKFYNLKKENFQIKNSDIFHIFTHIIDCGYSLEPPRRGGSNEYPQSMFFFRK